jgi:outer membrane protein
MRGLDVKISVMLPAALLALAIAGQAQTGPAPTKIGIINIQSAIIGTKDGQKAANELQTKFNPRRTQLEKSQAEIQQLREQLSKGSNTMSDDAKQALMRQIDDKTRLLNRNTEDAQAEFDAEQQKLLQGLGQKVMSVIDKYSRDNGFAVILDVSNPQTPVLYAANSVDITQEIIELYDKNAGTPAAAAPPAAPPAAKPAAPKK